MRAGQDGRAAGRAAAIGAVLLLHGVLVAMLAGGGLVARPPAAIRPSRLILPPRRAPEPTPLIPVPAPVTPAPALVVPVPEIRLAPSPLAGPARPLTVARAGPPPAHFGTATDAGLGIDVATSSVGGTGSRGSLESFQAAVRRRVLAGKRQPVLAWDRRQSCVVAYRVTVARSGALAGFSIDPCAVAEINEAARAAIRQAAPFPPPPDLGAATYDVQGSLIFHP
jgi:protein TonB